MKFVIRHRWGWNLWWCGWRNDWSYKADATEYADMRLAQQVAYSLDPIGVVESRGDVFRRSLAQERG